MKTKIKICGIRRIEDIEYISEFSPDYCGFICSEGYKRSVDAETAGNLIGKLNSTTVPVGVFVDEPIEYIISFVNQTKLKMIQLHGNEDNEYIANLKRSSLIPIIKAFVIKNKSELDEAILSKADYILLDSGKGSGKELDLEITESLKNINRPYFLAGGLSADNIKDKISVLSPFAVDTSSGVETDGKKDKNKIERFIKSIRA